MDGSDVSLAIRRARRSGAKSLDLSLRGLRTLPEDVFALRTLTALDVSGNELTAVDRGIAQLAGLEELNVANNRLESLADLDIASMPSLRSLLVEGNPMASSLGPAAARQLARPPAAPGQTPAQVIAGILTGTQQARTSAVAPGATAVSTFSKSADSEGPTDAAFDRMLAGDGDDNPWRKEQRVMLKEMEQLRARVQELESSQKDSDASPAVSGGDSTPAWLRESKFSATLPSRRSGLSDGDEATELRTQLREEQRKTKRAEQELQRVTLRLNEMDMKKGSVGSLPHFEMSEVEIGEVLNQGGFSVVHRGVWHTTMVAVKKLFDPNISAELLAEFDNEVEKLEQIRHPNILMILAVHRKPPSLCLIMEFVEGGSLYQLLHTPSRFNAAAGPVSSVPQRDVLDTLKIAGTAIAFLHARGIAHRDIKTQNVLLSPHMEVKLCDFGLARMKSEIGTGAMQFAGTPNYMAPEIFRNQKYTETVDVWAFGTMLWESLAVDIPYANLDPPDIRERVLEGRLLAMPVAASPTHQSIIQACWTLDHKARPSMAEVVNHLQAALGGGSQQQRRPRTAGAAMGTRDALGATGGLAGGGLGSRFG